MFAVNADVVIAVDLYSSHGFDSVVCWVDGLIGGRPCLLATHVVVRT